MADINLEGTGSSIAFGTNTTNNENLISLNLPEQVREALETTHLGTTDAKTYKPAKLKDVGDIQAVFDYDISKDPMILDDEETVTITLPLLTGQASAATIAFTGFVIAEGGQEFVNGTLMRLNRTFKVDGDLTITQAVLAS